MTVALYARVSSERQAEAGTIESQVTALLDHAARQGTPIPAELQFIDDGYSGATLIRPALERLRDMSAAGGLTTLYVHSPDRLARKYAYQVLLLEEFQRAGVQVCFLQHELGHSPEGDLLLQVQGMIAEYERAQLMERSRRGKRYAAQTGAVSALSHAPYGYHYVSKGESGGAARFEVQLTTARVVQHIFEWVGRERASLREVCRRLDAAQILTPSGKQHWNCTTVWGILQNTAYRGAAAFGKTRSVPAQPRLRPSRGQAPAPRRAGSSQDLPPEEWIWIPVPALIDEALFQAVQEQLRENCERARQRQWGARYLLQGVLVCAVCGYAYYGKSIEANVGHGQKRRYGYYQCTGADGYRFGGEPLCHNRAIRTEVLEQAVWDEVCAVLQQPQRMREEYERRLAEVTQHTSQERQVVEAHLAKLRQGIGRLIDSYAAGLITREEWEPRLDRVRRQVREWEAEVQQIYVAEAQRQELHLIVGQWEEFARRVQEGMAAGDWKERRAIIRTVVKRIEIAPEEVTIVYRITPPPFAPRPESPILPHCSGRSAALGRHGPGGAAC